MAAVHEHLEDLANERAIAYGLNLALPFLENASRRDFSASGTASSMVEAEYWAGASR